MKKRVCSIILTIVICLSLIASLSITTSAVSLPTISKNKPLITYTYNSTGKVYAYTDSTLKKKDTSHYIDCAKDECKILEIKGDAVKVEYPTSKGTNIEWFRREDFTYRDLARDGAQKSFVAQTKVTTYRWKNNYTTFGSVAKNDKCYLLRGNETSDWVQIIYPVSGGHKMAWVTGNDYCALTSASVPSKNNGSYSPRMTAPAKTNEYYYSNKNIFYSSGYGMPNCTAYAYGRAYEILGKKPNLCTRSAGAWYNYNKTNKYYSYGSTPKVGAIACWSKNGTSTGHVAVVEQVNNNGTVLISESHWQGVNFNTRTIKNNSSDYLKSWTFQGYIYIR